MNCETDSCDIFGFSFGDDEGVQNEAPWTEEEGEYEGWDSMFRFVDIGVSFCEVPGEKVGCGAGQRVGDDYAEKRGESEEANCFAVEEVGRRREELGELCGDYDDAVNYQ